MLLNQSGLIGRPFRPEERNLCHVERTSCRDTTASTDTLKDVEDVPGCRIGSAPDPDTPNSVENA